ncbi:MAG: 8-oxo-dGTP diphosphatase [Candidatus Portnoybacteria bacterium]|nr:8-oxo-dGTP diphosphatase [Candidatus Portnoybacteria bacterium]
MKLSTLCYVKDKGKTLMIHRVKKEGDMHKGKWNGLGGKLEQGETPEECVVREVKEEAGLTITKPTLKGFLTFPKFAHEEDWYVFIFVAKKFTGTLIDSEEGNLRWIDDIKLLQLNLWEGDRVFLKWLNRKGFFSGKFIYRGGRLIKHSATFYE